MRSHLLVAIGQDPVLRHVKLIAEPWDASVDGYRVGEFPPPWIEWNDQFRDEIRDFWNGRSAGIRTVATRLAGSSDLYADDGRSPYASVNFVTAHDGFTRARPGELRPQAQRGQRRGQPGRHRQQPVLEPRRRGRDHRQEDHRAAPPPGGEPDGDAVPVQRRTDDHRRRRTRPHPARQQQPLLPGQRALLDRLARRRRVAGRLRDHQGRAAAAPRAPRPAAAALLRGPADHPRRPEGPGLAAPVRPRDDRRRLARPHADRRWACSSPAPRSAPPAPTASSRSTSPSRCSSTPATGPSQVELPENDWVHSGEVVLSTDPKLPIGTPVKTGDRMRLGGRSVVVLREV